MKGFAKDWARPWLGFFAVLSLVAALDPMDRWFTREVGLSFWTATASDLAARSGEADFGSYVRYAQFLIDHFGWDMPSWYVQTWPPGFPSLIALIFKLTGEGAYLPKMLALALVFWSTALTVTLNFLPFHPSRWVRFICLSLLWLFPNLRYYSIGDGRLLAESTSMALFAMALAFLARGLIRGDRRSFYVSAAILALAANFRSSFDVTFRLVSVAFLALVAMWFLFAAVAVCVRPDTPSAWTALRQAMRSQEFLANRNALRTTVVCLLIFTAGTAPWKLYNYVHYGMFSLTTRGLWSLYWRPPESLPGFVHAGNTACILDLDFCRFVNANVSRLGEARLGTLLLAAFLANPRGWLLHRISELNWLWIGRPWKPPADSILRDYVAYCEGGGYVIALLLGLWLLMSRLGQPNLAEQRWALIVIGILTILHVCTSMMLFTFIHYEERYSLPLRLWCLWTPAVVMAISTVHGRSARETSAGPM